MSPQAGHSAGRAFWPGAARERTANPPAGTVLAPPAGLPPPGVLSGRGDLSCNRCSDICQGACHYCGDMIPRIMEGVPVSPPRVCCSKLRSQNYAAPRLSPCFLTQYKTGTKIAPLFRRCGPPKSIDCCSRPMGVPRKAAQPLADAMARGEVASGISNARTRLANLDGAGWQAALGPIGPTYRRAWRIIEGRD